jgi:hypothetical protein
MVHRLRHTKFCSKWPELVDDRGRATCACGARSRRVTRRVDDLIARVDSQGLIEARLRAFFGRLR